MNAALRAMQGFTLIELMIVLAVIALLLALGYPGYLDHVRKANRTEAMEAMGRAAVAQERFLFRYGSYASSLSAEASDVPPGLGLPATTRKSDDDPAYYDLGLSLSGPMHYTLTATPAGSTQAEDSCGTLSLTSTGQRSAAKSGCW